MRLEEALSLTGAARAAERLPRGRRNEGEDNAGGVHCRGSAGGGTGSGAGRHADRRQRPRGVPERRLAEHPGRGRGGPARGHAPGLPGPLHRGRQRRQARAQAARPRRRPRSSRALPRRGSPTARPGRRSSTGWPTPSGWPTTTSSSSTSWSRARTTGSSRSPPSRGMRSAATSCRTTRVRRRPREPGSTSEVAARRSRSSGTTASAGTSGEPSPSSPERLRTPGSTTTRPSATARAASERPAMGSGWAW